MTCFHQHCCQCPSQTSYTTPSTVLVYPCARRCLFISQIRGILGKKKEHTQDKQEWDRRLLDGVSAEKRAKAEGRKRRQQTDSRSRWGGFVAPLTKRSAPKPGMEMVEREWAGFTPCNVNRRGDRNDFKRADLESQSYDFYDRRFSLVDTPGVYPTHLHRVERVPISLSPDRSDTGYIPALVPCFMSSPQSPIPLSLSLYNKA